MYLTDTTDPNSSYETRERPAPNPRLNIKTSISSYWKVLFNRQKSSRRRGVNTEQESGMEEEEEVATTDLQQVQQEQQTDPVKFDDAEISVTPETSVLDFKAKAEQEMVNPIPAMSEEVHVLPISDETVSQLQDKMLND